MLLVAFWGLLITASTLTALTPSPPLNFQNRHAMSVLGAIAG